MIATEAAHVTDIYGRHNQTFERGNTGEHGEQGSFTCVCVCATMTIA